MTVIYSHFPEQHGLGVFSRFDSDTIYDVFGEDSPFRAIQQQHRIFTIHERCRQERICPTELERHQRSTHLADDG